VSQIKRSRSVAHQVRLGRKTQFSQEDAVLTRTSVRYCSDGGSGPSWGPGSADHQHRTVTRVRPALTEAEETPALASITDVAAGATDRSPRPRVLQSAALDQAWTSYGTSRSAKTSGHADERTDLFGYALHIKYRLRASLSIIFSYIEPKNIP
jgi:hypothetical protein